jgi:cytochrome P450
MRSLSPYITQNNPRVWDDPKRFDPSRFDAGAPAHDPYSYFPFGAGPRRCIGEQMAVYEILSVVSMLLLQFKFKVVPGVAIEDEWALTLSMTNGLPMTVEVRE